MKLYEVLKESAECAVLAIAIVALFALWLAATPDEVNGSGEPDEVEIGE